MVDSKFICLNCGFKDTGTYCSNCRNKLKVEPVLIYDLVSNRLKRVGFSSLNASPDLNVVEALYLDDLDKVIGDLLKKPQDILVLEQRAGGSLWFEIVALVEGDKANLNVETIFHLKDVLLERMAEKKVKLRKKGVNTISMNVLISYESALSDRQIFLINRSRKAKFSLFRSPAVHVSTMAMVLADRKLHASFRTYLSSPYYRQVDLSLKQIEFPPSLSVQPSHSLRDFVAGSIMLVAQPVLDYLEGASMITKPAFLVKLIEAGEIDALKPSTLVKYLVGAAVLSTILSAFFKVGIISFGIPIIDEFANISVFFAGGIINTSILHIPMKIVGGVGDFRSSFNAVTYVSIIFYPIVVFSQGIHPIIFNGDTAPYSIAFTLAASYYYAVMSEIHKISYVKTFIVGLLTQFIIIGMVLSLLVFV